MATMKVICHQCGREYECQMRHKPRGKHTFCSNACHSKYKNDQFLESFPKTDELTSLGILIAWSRPIFPKDSGTKETRVLVTCTCGNQMPIAPVKINKSTYRGMCHKCILANRLHARSGSKASNWSGGRQITAQGYVWLHESLLSENERELFRPMFLRMRHIAKYVAEHRLVIARQLGRPLLSDEIVHHKNGIKTDNRIENLEVVTPTQHRQIDLKYYTLWQRAAERIKELETELALLKVG